MSATGRPLPDYWPSMVAYHVAREALYRALICDLELSPGARILDAGCGDCFYSQLLAEVVGPRSQIAAVDIDPIVLNSATGLRHNIHRCLSDLDRPGFESATFDAIWLCRTMHSVHDPIARLANLAPLLRPGGRFIVVENDTAHNPILAMPAEFELRLRAARLEYEKTQCRNGAPPERYKAAPFLPRWLAQAGLGAITVRTYVSEDVAPLDPPVDAYLRLMLAWEATRLGPFLSPAAMAEYKRAFDPASPDYLPRQDGFYCLELTTVACATQPEIIGAPPRKARQ
jgi:SAM-dependent methyltransferase